MRKRVAVATATAGGLIVLGAAVAHADPDDDIIHKAQQQICNDKEQKDNSLVTHIKIITPGGNFECTQSADID